MLLHSVLILVALLNWWEAGLFTSYVLLITETVAFVEKLFRCLESESYLKREETPPPPPTKSKPSEQIQSSGQNTNRRLAEDVRQKEVTMVTIANCKIFYTWW